MRLSFSILLFIFEFAKEKYNRKGVSTLTKLNSFTDSFITLFGKMHEVFTEPSFFYFTEFIKVILIISGKRERGFISSATIPQAFN
jgi:hypothetical protein